ncbi:zinc finger CCCH domain-containing protein 13 isoform X2 [Dendrobium catenatum]|uniref:zinc finger CCCH domain-containing protein 13 isoform X2 n=1 Tax=Dendrobium catenatum TaxID=906689 RepID=UPI0009F44C9E|nr:zinc finger CCCH domain-containing protein 13 isoform X2 [Dendrobium catenatum]
MPRSSRHKSHRSHKHNSRDATERSESEDDGSSRNRKLRLVEAGPGSGARVSRNVEAEKRKASSSPQAFIKKDKGSSENGDFSSGRKRKEREEDSATPDRWNGSGKDNGLPEKVSKEETLGHVDLEKVEKSKLLTAESKSRSSRRREGSTESYVESGNRTDSVKRRSEKEHARREYRDDKEKDIDRPLEREKDRERVVEKDKKVQDSRHGRSDDVESKSQRSRRGPAEVDWNAKKDSTERQARDDLHNAEFEKDPEAFMTKRRCSSDGNEKGLDDGRNSDDRRLSSRDDYIKNGSHKVEVLKDERYKYDRYRDKYYKDLDRNQRHRDSRHKDERSSRDYISDRPESKSVRDREKYFESYKKSRLHGSDRELSPHADDHGIKSRGSRLQKRSSYDEIDDHYGLRKISTKESRSNVDKDASNSSKFDYRHQGKVDSSLNNTLSRSSLSPKAHSSKDQTRRGGKLAEYTHGEPFCGDRPCPTEDHDKISVVRENVCEPLSSERAQRRDRVNSDDRERQMVLESPTMENNSQADLQMPEGASASPSPSLFKRTNHFPASSPGHLVPPPPRRGMDNSSTYEDDMRITSGDCRSNGRYRSCDPNMERAQGGAWKNGLNWSAPLPNGFIPFQHGHPSPGFTIQHFPPPLFAARPYPEINQTGIPYHIHEVADRFPGQGHPFGWHHHVDDSCPPQIHGWDGGNSLFGDKLQAYRRPDWNRNRHLTGGRGWDLNAEILKGQSSSIAEFSSPQEQTDESKGAYPNLESNNGVENLRSASDVAAHVKQLNDPPDNKSVEACLETKLKRTSQFGKKFSGDSLNLCNYFSKIEISADLLHPELYKEVKDLLASVNFTDIYNVSKDEDAKKNKIQNSRKFPNLRSSLLPAAADATFKRAMSVYEKQSCRRQLKPPAAAITSLPKEPSTANDNSAATLMEEDDHKSITGDADSSLVHIEVEQVEKQSDLNSDVDILESSQTSEAIMPVCKVNFIRIHNSTENTH